MLGKPGEAGKISQRAPAALGASLPTAQVAGRFRVSRRELIVCHRLKITTALPGSLGIHPDSEPAFASACQLPESRGRRGPFSLR